MTGKTIISGFDRIVATADNPDGSKEDGHSLRWFCPPEQWKDESNDPPLGTEGYGGNWNVDSDHNLVLYPPAKKDFWRRTYYAPLLVKDDGSVLYATLSESQVYTMTTSFVLYAVSQFDQAGLVIRLDHEHWIKTGIEVVDGKARLSCVVTNVYSDWSTQPWAQEQVPSAPDGKSTASSVDTTTVTRVDCTIRVHCRTQGNFVVEARRRDSAEWELVRICHLSGGQVAVNDPLANDPAVTKAFQGPVPKPGDLWAGVFGCCPIDQRGQAKVVFKHFSVTEGSDFDHTATED